MAIEYFWVSTIIITIFSILIWYFCNSYKIQNNVENFNNLIETLKKLNFTDRDITKFTSELIDSNDPDEIVNKIVKTASKKGLTDKKILEELIG